MRQGGAREPLAAQHQRKLNEVALRQRQQQYRPVGAHHGTARNVQKEREFAEDVAQRWLNDGAALVVVTRGSNGIIGFTADGSVEVDGAKIIVADTVGAGDTVGAIIVEAMIERGIMALTGDVLKATLHRAAVAAGITCSRKGAQPPYKHELKNV